MQEVNLGLVGAIASWGIIHHGVPNEVHIKKWSLSLFVRMIIRIWEKEELLVVNVAIIVVLLFSGVWDEEGIVSSKDFCPLSKVLFEKLFPELLLRFLQRYIGIVACSELGELLQESNTVVLFQSVSSFLGLSVLSGYE